MSRRASATLIGAFVVGGIALILGAIIATGAGTVFKPKERAVMHFTGSAYGLQQGAPVVFRGVRVGSVTSIGLAYDEGSGIFSIPVVAELDPRMLRRLVVAEKAGAPLAALIDRGLRAQLSLQSFLTGLLYVDLDLRPDKPAIRFEREPTMTEIPTNATPIQALKEQLESVDLRRLVDDVSAIAASVRQLTGSPPLRDALADGSTVTAQAKALTAQLDRRIAPVMS
jgi:paraquat-inducible protein B